jgi:hypothetical protein
LPKKSPARKAKSAIDQAVGVEPLSTYTAPDAPTILIERMLAYAYADGIVTIAVGANRVFHDLSTDGMGADILPTAYLKLTLKGARQLHAALERAVLLSENPKGATN